MIKKGKILAKTRCNEILSNSLTFANQVLVSVVVFRVDDGGHAACRLPGGDLAQALVTGADIAVDATVCSFRRYALAHVCSGSSLRE